MTMVEKLVNFLTEREAQNYEIKNASSTLLVRSYYEHLGITDETTLNDWFIGLATKKYPHFATITRAIRKARELTPRWQKDQDKKQNEIDDFKDNVGY